MLLGAADGTLPTDVLRESGGIRTDDTVAVAVDENVIVVDPPSSVTTRKLL
jgi:hypothetical protein